MSFTLSQNRSMFKSVSHSASINPQLVVRAIFQDESCPVTWEDELKQAVARPEFSRTTGQLVEAFPSQSPRCLILGLGSKSKFNVESFRKACSSLGRKLATAKIADVVLDLDLDSFELGHACGQTLGLLSWHFTEFKSQSENTEPLVDLSISSLNEQFDKGLSYGLAIAKSANWARDMVATPPNVATPGWMAGQASKLEALGVSIDVFRGSKLEEEKLTGLIHVGKASVNEPCMIRLEYRPLSTSEQQPVVLIGKTITYDTGGLAIKTREGMRGMKGDKAGGCAVLGAMHAIATVLKPSFPVVALLVAAENSISANAMRNDDILKYRNGVTVEVTNTDAEGRLVLADGLVWACEKENPRCIVDMATLTGGVVIALGSVFAGLFSNDEELASSLELAGLGVDEKVWRLPMHQDYCEMMKSEVADIVNSASSRGAHPIAGAAFLSHFVTEGTPWAHIDIAGTSNSDRNKDCFVVGPTGFGVQLIANFVSKMMPH